MKSAIFQHLPDVCLLRMLTNKRIWRMCMKHLSQDSPSLCNNQMNGVGLGTDGADALKKHFFYFDDVPSISQNTNFYKDYESVIGRNNLINNTCYLLNYYKYLILVTYLSRFLVTRYPSFISFQPQFCLPVNADMECTLYFMVFTGESPIFYHHTEHPRITHLLLY